MAELTEVRVPPTSATSPRSRSSKSWSRSAIGSGPRIPSSPSRATRRRWTCRLRRVGWCARSRVAVGDNVSEGSVLLRIAAGNGGGAAGEESAPAGAGGSGGGRRGIRTGRRRRQRGGRRGIRTGRRRGQQGGGHGSGRLCRHRDGWWGAAVRFFRHEGGGRGAGEPCRRLGGDCIARIIGNRRSPGSRHRRLLRRPGHRSAGRRRRPYPSRGPPCLPGE